MRKVLVKSPREVMMREEVRVGALVGCRMSGRRGRCGRLNGSMERGGATEKGPRCRAAVMDDGLRSVAPRKRESFSRDKKRTAHTPKANGRKDGGQRQKQRKRKRGRGWSEPV